MGVGSRKVPTHACFAVVRGLLLISGSFPVDRRCWCALLSPYAFIFFVHDGLLALSVWLALGMHGGLLCPHVACSCELGLQLVLAVGLEG